MTECTKWVQQQAVPCKLHGRTADDKWWDNCRIVTNPDELQKTVSSHHDWHRVRSIRHGQNPQIGHHDLLEAESRLLKFCPESFIRTDGTSFCDERPLKRPCNGSRTGMLSTRMQKLCESHFNLVISVRLTRETLSWRQSCDQSCDSELLEEIKGLKQQMVQVLCEIKSIREEMQSRDIGPVERRDVSQLPPSPEQHVFFPSNETASFFSTATDS